VDAKNIHAEHVLKTFLHMLRMLCIFASTNITFENYENILGMLSVR
jgi:hypothetical protein